MKRMIGHTSVYGVRIDDETRCAHYHSTFDRIAIQFYCCRRFYACFDCHKHMCDHSHQVWPQNKFDYHAVLCGSCGKKMSIHEYLHSDFLCPHCHVSFNPGCRFHYPLYFEWTTN